MSGKKRLRVVLINILLFGALFGLVSFNKEVLRPALSHIPSMAPLVGSFPDFIAGYVMSLFFVNGALTMEPRRSRLLVALGACLVFVVLALEEVRPTFGASTHYDVLDIVAAGVGSLLAMATYEVVARRRRGASEGAETES